MRTVRIPLHSRKYPGLIAVVDEQDAPMLLEYRWNPCKGHTTFYAAAPIDGHGMRMHRLIMGVTDPGIQVDHRNHNGLDNRRSNLRLATGTQNMANTRMRAANRSGAKGVWFQQGRWFAKSGGIHLGSFTTWEAAVSAFDHAIVEANGEFALTNAAMGIIAAADIIAPKDLDRYRFEFVTASPFRGVTWQKSSAIWKAQIKIGGKNHHLGLFEGQIDAARAYDQAAFEAWGDRAILNFPDDAEEMAVAS